jgi:hypothetical protein
VVVVEFKVQDGKPYMDGKLVVMCGSRDVSGEAEYNYMCALFPDTEWMWDYDKYTDSQFLVPARCELTEDFKDIMAVFTTQMEDGDFSAVDELIPHKLTKQCETDTQVMLYCECDVEDEYGEDE